MQPKIPGFQIWNLWYATFHDGAIAILEEQKPMLFLSYVYTWIAVGNFMLIIMKSIVEITNDDWIEFGLAATTI